MTVVERQALVGHDAARMYALVADVESYPRFLPWCERGEIVSRGPGSTIATVYANFHGLRFHFTTENEHRPPQRIRIKLVSGPFRELEGEWSFTALGENACKIELRLRYRFSSALLEKTLGAAFGRIADNLVDAFVRRAEQTAGTA